MAELGAHRRRESNDPVSYVGSTTSWVHAGRAWIEPLSDLIRWEVNGLENRVVNEHFGTRGWKRNAKIEFT